ncbi:FtsX-like permease family protein [Jatrophihabitans fulvus]
MTLARHELRAHGRSALALALVCGVLAGAALAAVTVLWRTESAYDRLVRAAALDDVRVTLAELAPRAAQRPAARAAVADAAAAVARMPGVRAATSVAQWVGRVDGPGVRYSSVAAPLGDTPVGRPVVIGGRAARADRPDEAVVNEDLAVASGLRVGDTVGLGLLSGEQFLRFSTGVGEPAGGRVTLRIVGVFRFPHPGYAYNSLVATPAFARAHPDTIARTLLLRTDGAAAAAAVARAAERVDRALTARFGRPQQPWVVGERPGRGPDTEVGPALTVLRSGLFALLFVVCAAGLLVAAQLSGRWAELTRDSQQVERALGLPIRSRVGGRVLAAVPAALAVAAGAVGGALLGAFVEPLGALARYEPHPGWLPRPLLAVPGALVASALVLAAVAAAMAQAGRRSVPRAQWFTVRRTRGLDRSAVPGGAATGFARALARPRGSGASSLPVRSMLAGVLVLTVVVVVAAGLHDRVSGLSHQPASYGWRADFAVIDDTPDLDARLARDPRVAAAEQLTSASVLVRTATGRADVVGYGRRAVSGRMPYTVAAGRVPARAGEVAVGPRLAADLGLGVGDRLRAGPHGARLTVVGVVVLPVVSREPLGSSLLVTASQLRTVARTVPYAALFVRGTDPAAASAMRAELQRDHELGDPSAPAAVAALDQLTGPTRILLAVLGLALLVLVAQNARLLLRRRREQLAIAAAMGVTRPRLAGAVAAALAFVTLPGLVAGAALGWLVCRVVVAETAPRLGLALSPPAWTSTGWPAVAALGLTLAVSATAALAATTATGARRPRPGE